MLEQGKTTLGTLTEQWNTPEQWKIKGTPQNTSETPWNTKRAPTQHQRTTLEQKNHGKQRTIVVFFKEI